MRQIDQCGRDESTHAGREASKVLNSQRQCRELSMKYELKSVNGACAQSVSFLDGHGVLAVYPTVHLAPIFSGSAPLLWLDVGGDSAPWNVPRALISIREGR